MQALLNVKEAAVLTGLSVSTLNKLRMGSDGPRYVRLSKRRVAYELHEIQRWIGANTHQSTDEYRRKAAG